MGISRSITVQHVDLVKYVFAMFGIGTLAFMWGFSVYMGVDGVILAFCTTTIGSIFAWVISGKIHYKNGYKDGTSVTTKKEEF